ncbi:VWA domain-containing protein [Kiritimatiellaeota bacterium B1221]|nr:VWA domain-containing protein [Kiritimatiellaeota bacterium B1221]
MILRFAHPWFLLLWCLIPLWVWSRNAKRFHQKLNFPSGATLKKLPVTAAQRFHPFLHLIGALAWILLILALARPQSGLRQRSVTSDTIDIVLAIDTSTSMRAIDLGATDDENRLDAVKIVAEKFIETRKMDRISLLSFAGLPYTKSPLTLDHGWLTNRLRELRTGELPDGTAIGSAVVSGINRLRDSEAETKIMVLLTDGINTRGEIDPIDAAKLSVDPGIKIYTIGAGSDGPVRMPVRSFMGKTIYNREKLPIDTETLQQIADISGGRFFRARDGKELDEVFQEIDKLERTEIELDEYTLYTEQFLWFAVAGLALLLTERLLSASRFGRTLA